MWFGEISSHPSRVMISRGSFYDFLGFVPLGIPVVAPGQPKMRDSGQLQSNYAFNFALEAPDLSSEVSRKSYETTLDFLQIKYLLVAQDERSKNEATRSVSRDARTVHFQLSTFENSAHRPSDSYSVFERTNFSSFLLSRHQFKSVTRCPILRSNCSILFLSKKSETSNRPRLALCRRDCVWTYSAPPVDSSNLLLLPVTYDETLQVSLESGEFLQTFDAGGFLAVGHNTGIPEGLLTISISPDLRMWSRPLSSYANVVTLIATTAVSVTSVAMGRKRRQSRRNF